MPALDGLALALLAFCILGGTFGSYALYLQGVHDAGSMRASLLGTIEPITATITTVLMLGTTFSPADLVGFAMIGAGLPHGLITVPGKPAPIDATSKGGAPPTE